MNVCMISLRVFVYINYLFAAVTAAAIAGPHTHTHLQRTHVPCIYMKTQKMMNEWQSSMAMAEHFVAIMP